MIRLLRQPVVVVLLLTQILFGSSAGGLICLGGGCEPDPAEEHVCSHHETPHHSPVPVQPHNEDCACVDVSLPIARSDASRVTDDLARTVAIPTPASPEVCIHATAIIPSAGRALTAGAPPPPGIRTTRLLI